MVSSCLARLVLNLSLVCVTAYSTFCQAVAWQRPEAAPCNGWRHQRCRDACEDEPGRVKPAAACSADPEAAAGGAHVGAAAVCVFIHCWNETAGGRRLDKQPSDPSLSRQIRLG